MKDANTWRELLGNAIADVQERQRIANELRVSSVTLTRWSTGTATPRQDKLLRLLEALPHERDRLIELISKEYPYFSTQRQQTEERFLDIPSAFYGRVLNAHTSSLPQLRSSTICLLILQQILGHIDPKQLGLAIFISQCVPPVPQHKVRSLRKLISRGSLFQEMHTDSWTIFLGAESQVGQAVTKGHPIIVQTAEERARFFPTHHTIDQSLAVYPLLFGDRVAGTLSLASTQPKFFSQTRQSLIQNYTELLMLAFEHHEFYDLNAIDLGIMPAEDIQQKCLATFHQRVSHMMQRMVQQQQTILRSAAELLVWQEIEEELLAFGLNSSY